MRKIIIKPLIYVLIISGIYTSSCVNNNELDLYGEVNCDTTDITWVSTIEEILKEKCVVCHGPVTSYNNVRHDSYESEMVVVNDGRLRGVVNHLPGFVQMPFERGKLPDCKLRQINIWLDNGAPEF